MADEKHICPVCEKHEFTEYNSYDFCPICKWHDDAILTDYPDLSGYYKMSLNEAREAYKNGQEIF
jgi:hypothetical protein